ncbi:MAG: peptide deformylase [Dehalococcoidia bacterium]|nr:peptide deformylase [Dehalococcoidia bacterium]
MHIVPDSVLRERAKRVSNISPSIQKLIDDMIETMRDSHGVGLAANQVGVLQRVIVIQLPDDEEPRVFINPELIKQEGERDVEEGCLSIPGYRGLVKRSVKVKAKGLDRKGKAVRVNADELLAQALEHEIDHLNGTLYIDRLVDRTKLWKEEAEEAPQNQEEREETPVEAQYTG